MYTPKFYYLRRVACYIQSEISNVKNDLYIVKFQSQKFSLTLFRPSFQKPSFNPIET